MSEWSFWNKPSAWCGTKDLWPLRVSIYGSPNCQKTSWLRQSTGLLPSGEKDKRTKLPLVGVPRLHVTRDSGPEIRKLQPLKICKFMHLWLHQVHYCENIHIIGCVYIYIYIQYICIYIYISLYIGPKKVQRRAKFKKTWPHSPSDTKIPVISPVP